jgi:hypothetical protein
LAVDIHLLNNQKETNYEKVNGSINNHSGKSI